MAVYVSRLLSVIVRWAMGDGRYAQGDGMKGLASLRALARRKGA